MPAPYVIFTVCLPLLWWLSVALARGYEPRFIGLGPDEFRRVLRAAAGLTACIAIVSYVAKCDVARGYVVIALPCTAVFDLVARCALRRRLHRQRRSRRVHAPDDRGGLCGCRHRSDHRVAPGDSSRPHGRGRVHDHEAAPAELAGVPVCGGLGRIGPRYRTWPPTPLPCWPARAERRAAASARLATGGDGHRPVRGPCHHGCRGPADHHPPGRRDAAAPCRPSRTHRDAPGRQEHVRQSGGADSAARAGAAPRRASGLRSGCPTAGLRCSGRPGWGRTSAYLPSTSSAQW